MGLRPTYIGMKINHGGTDIAENTLWRSKLRALTQCRSLP